LDFKRQYILFFSLFYLPACLAELSDPTRPVFHSTIESQQTDLLKLSAIWISGKNKRATINGATAKQGEIILTDIKIIKINKHSVLIEQNGESRMLSILNGSYKKPATQK